MHKNQVQWEKEMLLCQTNPSVFVEEVLGDKLWKKQQEIINSLVDNREVAVRSCHGAGKTFLAARALLWFLNTHPGSIVISTAPTFRQVQDLLWREVRFAFNKTPSLGGNMLHTKYELDTDWYALGLSTDEPDRFQGYHAEHILVIADESSGVDEEIFDAVKGVLTSRGSRLLMIGNPIKTNGYFYEAFRKEGVKKIRISAFDTPNFEGINGVEDLTEESVKKAKLVNPKLCTPDWALERLQEWGADSPLFQSKVLGDFPSQSDDTLISLYDIESAIGRETEATKGAQVKIGADIARFGPDKTVFIARQGTKIRAIEKHTKADLMATSGRLIAFARRFNNPEINIDEIGVGSGVVDRLTEQGIPNVHGINVARNSSNPEQFKNMRAEAYWLVRDMIKEMDIPDDSDLVTELSSLRYKYNSQGQLLIEGKDEMKKRGLKSPDVADALMLTFCSPPKQIEPNLRWI